MVWQSTAPLLLSLKAYDLCYLDDWSSHLFILLLIAFYPYIFSFNNLVLNEYISLEYLNVLDCKLILYYMYKQFQLVADIETYFNHSNIFQKKKCIVALQNVLSFGKLQHFFFFCCLKSFISQQIINEHGHFNLIYLKNSCRHLDVIDILKLRKILFMHKFQLCTAAISHTI